MADSQRHTARVTTADRVLTADRSTSTDRVAIPERYEFVPVQLRHHFKVRRALVTDEDSREALADREAVRCARRTRSAFLVAASQSPAPPPAPSPVLYSNAIERAITTRMTFARAIDGLERYFEKLTIKLKQLEELQGPKVLAPEWLCDRRVKLPTLVQTQRQIVNSCQACLNDCDLYLGIYESLPSPPAADPSPVLRFVACSAKSTMLRRVLPCFLPQELQDKESEEVTINQPNEPQDHEESRTITVQALVAKVPLVVDDIAEHPAEEIYCFSPEPPVAGPFACFPLLTGVPEDDEAASPRVLGAISVDSCRKAQRLLPQAMSVDALHAFLLRVKLKDAAEVMQKAKVNGARFLELTENELLHKPNFQRLKVATRKKLLELIRAFQRGSRMHLSSSGDATPPFFAQDEDALQFLEDVARLSGSFLAGYRSFHWLREIANVTCNPVCTAYDVYDVLLRAVTLSIDSLERVVIWKITKKGAIPLPPGTSSASIPWEVDVMASTAVPEDRLHPFLDGQERKIKRITLFKEERSDRSLGSRQDPQEVSREEDTCAPFIRGAITSITVGSTPSLSGSSPPNLPCEGAMYHVAWTDRSFQSLSWKQVRQLLPVRNMNAKHFQLRHLCQRLEQQQQEGDDHHGAKNRSQQPDGEEECAPRAVRIKNPNALALVLRDASRPASVKYALEVDFTAQSKVPQRVSAFLVRAVAISEQSLACVRGREARAAKREQSVAKDTQLFKNLGLTPSADALRALQDIVDRIFQGIAINLPGVHLQIAELQGDGSELKYTFVGNGSTLRGRSLYRGQGVSFSCLESKRALVVGDSSQLRSRLRRMGPSTDKEARAGFPYIFVPLFHEDCPVGVLSIDSFDNVSKGRRDEPHPEAGVLEYLVALAKLLARAIYAKRRSNALYELQHAASEPLRSPQQLLFYACRALKDALVGSWRVRVAEVDGAQGKTTLVYDLTEAEREQAKKWVFNVARPLEFRWKELLPDTIAELLNQMDPTTTICASESVNRLLAVIREGEQERLEVVKRYQNLIAAEVAGESGASSSKRAAETAEKAKLLERQIADKYFLMLNGAIGVGEELSSSPKNSDGEPQGAERIENERYIAHTLSLFLGTTAGLYSSVDCLSLPTSKVFLTVAMLPQFYARCDQIYVQRVADITSRYLSALQERVQRSRVRTQALEKFRMLRDRALTETAVSEKPTSPKKNRSGRVEHRLSPANELDMEALLQLQRQIITLIECTLGNPHVYFGLQEPGRRLLRYTSASKTSVMTSKQLKHGHGVSFMALEKQVPIVITRDSVNNDVDSDAALFKKLRFFTNEPVESRKWPFIVVPVGKLGVLALDNMEAYEQDAGDSQPELGVVDFLRKIGQGFAEVLVKTRERMGIERQRLRDDAFVRVMTACEDLKEPPAKAGSPALYLPHLIVQQLENALNGVDAYIGMVEPLCERIRFLCASTHSRMENQVVDTIESLSFHVFAQQRAVVIPQLAQYFQQQQVQQQHTSQLESHPPTLKFFGSTSKLPRGPFVCVPIPFVGVLSVDTFPGAAGGVFSHTYPEDGVVTFLERVANHLGENIRSRAANEARKTLPTLFCGNRTTFQLLFQEILTLIARNMVAAVELRAVRFDWTQEGGKLQEKATLASLRRSHQEPFRTADQDERETHELLRWLESRYSVQGAELGMQENTEVDKLHYLRVQQLREHPEILVVHCSATCDVEDDAASLAPTALVIRRVKGATWTYDEDFLLSIISHVDALIEQVNARVEAIVARRMAIQRLGSLCTSLESFPPQEAVKTMRSTMLSEAMEIVAEALSKNNCDVYLGERQSSGSGDSNASQLQLHFIAASSRSFMQDVALSLADVDNQSLTVVQSLQKQKSAQILLTQEEPAVRALTAKKAERVFMVAPMGDNHVLCSDSLGREAFVPGKRPVVEADLVEFFHFSAAKLHEAILSTCHRASYDQLRQLTTLPHNDLGLFFSTVLDVLQRDLVTLHSQQIVSLGNDFTSAFRLEAWYGERTRRPIATLREHFCSVCDCKEQLIAHGVHAEAKTLLPMTNLPRTLDASRSSLLPAEGTEKRGSFACTCLATMLDAQVSQFGGEPKLALCVFSHDVQTGDRSSPTRAPRRAPTAGQVTKSEGFFTAYQRRYFFAFAAVATDVFTYVFRACALETFATEQLVMLQERLGAKDGLVVRFTRNDDGVASGERDDADETTEDPDGRNDAEGGNSVPFATAGLPSTVKGTVAMVLFSQQPNNYPKGKALRGKLERKVRQFYASEAPLAIFMTRKAAPAPPSAAIKGAMSSSAKASATNEPLRETRSKRGPASLFGGRKLFGYNRKKRQEEEEEKKAKEQRQLLLSAAPALQALAPSRQQQTEQQTVTLHVFVRALEYQDRCDVLALALEHQTVAAAESVERSIHELTTQADAIVVEFLARLPRGDEEIHAKRFCSDASTPTPTQTDGRGGGGFLLFSLLKDAREHFQQQHGALGASMRLFITGAQAIARVQPADHATGSDSDPSSVPNPTVFDYEEDPVNSAVTALARVALVASGVKRETAMALAPTELLKEFLRADVGKKLMKLEPTDRKHWAALTRARSLLRGFENDVQAVREPLEADTGSTSSSPLKVTRSGTVLAIRALMELLLVQSAVMRYVKQLDADLARDHKRLREAPAIMLQCFVRQKQAQKELAKRKREFLAARAIQCAFRQHLARRRLLFLKWTRAAIKVQRAYRKKRQRAKGSRPQGLTAELLAVSQKYGAVAAPTSAFTFGEENNAAWRVNMAAFGSFQEYLASKVGREQLKREEALMWRQRKQLEHERSQLPREEALREDVGDLFELLDDAGSGELSRERTTALITRLHVPLSVEEVADVVAMMDSDGSGGISMDEFLRWFAHEFPLLQRRAPRACGVVTRRDWQWVIQQSARSALLKRWRAMRTGAVRPRYGVGDQVATIGNAQEEEEEEESVKGEVEQGEVVEMDQQNTDKKRGAGLA